MTAEDIDKYLSPAILNLYGKSTIRAALALDQELGVDWYAQYRSKGADMPLTEDAKQLYKQLAGPYGKTILRAYRIKKGLENDRAVQGIQGTQNTVVV